MPEPLTFEIAINRLWPGEKLPRGDPRWKQHTASFLKEWHTIESLIQRVAGDGCAFAPVMRDGYRSTLNFISAQHIALDDDRGTLESSLEALAEDPFIADHAAFLYETPSSTPEHPKSRIVFVLDQSFNDASDYRTAQEALWWKYGATDEHVKEPARFFYGRPGARYINLGNVLYLDVLHRQVVEPYLKQGGVRFNGHRIAKQIGDTIPVTERNSTLTSLAGSMRRRGIPLPVIRSTLSSVNAEMSEVPLPEEELDTIVKSVSRYPTGAEGPTDIEAQKQVAPVKLRFRSAAEIARETPDSVPWVAEPWVALGSLTELDGKIKAGGKTTWLLALCRKVLDGQPFMGLPTMKTPVVFLTEQPMTSFRAALRRADLLDREDFRVLYYHDTIGTPWPQVIEAAKQECLRIGAKLLCVDTLPQFAGIRGDSENSSGATLEALEPIQGVVALGIGVIGVRHDRKAGGDVGDSGRGSSAWGGVADTIISIRRGDGNASPTVRIIQSLSRFDGPPDKLVIDLRDGEYVALGTATKVAEQQAREALWKAMPESEEHAKTRDELIEAAEVKATVGKDVINKWHAAGHLDKRGKGVANNPERFWKLDISRSEPPVVATNQQSGHDTEEAGNPSKVGRSGYRHAVATDQHSSGAAVTDGGQETSAADPGDTSQSRSVGTTTLNSDRPTSEDSSEDVLEVD